MKPEAEASVERQYRKWLYTPDAHVKKCAHGSYPDFCIACAHAKTEREWKPNLSDYMVSG